MTYLKDRYYFYVNLNSETILHYVIVYYNEYTQI